MWCNLDFWSHIVVGGVTWDVLQKRSPELCWTMGEMHNSEGFLCRERPITVPSLVALLLWEVGQGYYLLNADCKLVFTSLIFVLLDLARHSFLVRQIVFESILLYFGTIQMDPHVNKLDHDTDQSVKVLIMWSLLPWGTKGFFFQTNYTCSLKQCFILKDITLIFVSFYWTTGLQKNINK